MKKYLITFSGAMYEETTKNIVENGKILGADQVVVYDDVWLMNHPFYKQNKWLWEHHHKRGFGWYAWKPFIIYHALQHVNDGDIVMFTDADCYPIRDFSVLYDTCDKIGGIMLFNAGSFIHKNWCKRDCYIVMGQDDPTKYYNVIAGVARFMLFQRGPWISTQFLMEWITYCVNPLATTFDKSVIKQEHPELMEHRTEQAIMTNLGHKYGLKFYREICDHGNGIPMDFDLYPQLFVQSNPSDVPGGTKETNKNLGSSFSNVDLIFPSK